MNRCKIPLILWLSVSLLILISQVAPAVSAQSGNNGVISGTAWVDANGNGIQEPSEEVASGVTIEVRNSDASLAGRAVTDEAGFYIVSDLAYGLYSVSAIEHDGATTTEQTVELNEINGAMSVDFAMKAPVMKFQFLPLVRR
ncbi:MAG: SdrD B-like domain-containing protein [Caldilineaceae bacterium]